MSQEKFAERMHITDQAIRHEEADRIPIWCQYGNTPFELSNGAVTYRDSMYDYEKAADAIIKFHADFRQSRPTFRRHAEPVELLKRGSTDRPGFCLAERSRQGRNSDDAMQLTRYTCSSYQQN